MRLRIIPASNGFIAGYDSFHKSSAAPLIISPLLDDHVGGFRRGLSLVNPLPHSFAGMSIAQICILSKAMSDVQLKELPTLFHAPRVARQLESFVKPATNLTIADW
jgi:hypothetical protein